KTLLIGAVFLFLGATVAQSVQWLLDTWAANQWIYFAFALVGFITVLLGGTAIIREWRRLVKLKKRMQLQQQSTALWHKSAVGFAQDLSAPDSEQDKALCLDIAASMGIDQQNPSLNQWQKQINEGHSGTEIAYLFSRNVLQPFDKKAKKLINKHAAEAAIIVAISPLALVDMFFIAWRNIRLINQIARIYGIELGYISRLRLLHMVLLNVAFAGASDLVQDIGMDWLSQDLTAKLSARVAQGIGVGLLTARLGIKAMEFCRPLTFQRNEKPRLSSIHRELLSSLKSTVLATGKVKETEKM
ncbi:MAG TPA: TIGR01620 family protein, partial [Pasteurellaceae bacterium]|nr:TIGR01620 family protein [Pasteurellaceae bacterium]